MHTIQFLLSFIAQFDTGWVDDQRFNRVDADQRSAALQHLRNQLKRIVPHDDVYIQSIRLEVKMDLINEITAVKIKARQVFSGVLIDVLIFLFLSYLEV